RLRGVWQCVVMQADGRRMEFQPGQTPTVTFEGAKIIFAQKGASGTDLKGPATPVKLDPTKTPKEIDIGDKWEIKGIYAVDGDTAKLMHVIGKNGQPVPKLDRPKEFTPKADDGYVCMELKRIKQ